MATHKTGEDRLGRCAFDGLDRVLHERARLGVLTSLAAQPAGVVFSDLNLLCALTESNLSRPLQVLRQDGVIESCPVHPLRLQGQSCQSA